MYRNALAGLVLTVASVFVGAPDARAVSTGLSIQPLKATHTLNPGEEISGAVQITNAGENTVNVGIKVEDFVPLAGTYNIQIVQRANGISTVRDWVTLDAPASFELEKGGTRTLSYTIKAPPDAEPGGHFGVVLFKASELPTGAQQLQISTQVGMLVLVTVPGSRLEQGRVTNFSGSKFITKSPIDFTFRFENTGTVHFEPKGVITVTNIFGKEVGKVDVGGQVVLPTGVKDLVTSVNFDGVLVGRYKATLELFDGEGNEIASEHFVFYAYPVWYTIAFIVTIVVLFFVIRFVRRNVTISISKKI